MTNKTNLNRQKNNNDFFNKTMLDFSDKKKV